ncbi:hypothetical protein M0R45_006035 [Rubus argutus]|uniref:Uncharacterized protein n=1 Tax=Rubus argutus TaxID=59490 RepID=A0AAW1YP94_RUBAR
MTGLTPYSKRYRSPPDKKQSRQEDMTSPSRLDGSSQFVQGFFEEWDGDELKMKRSNTDPVPISRPAAGVKWITFPSPTYIPAVIWQKMIRTTW